MQMTANNVYAIFAATNSGAIDTRVESVFQKRYRLAPGQWLVSYSASLPSDVYQAIKNAGGDIQCIVAQLAPSLYYGWHDKAIWDWIDGATRGA